MNKGERVRDQQARQTQWGKHQNTKGYKMLNDNGIYINRSRIDADSYSKKIIIQAVEKFSKFFYIRTNRCDFLTSILLEVRDWEKVEINQIEYEVLSIEDQLFARTKVEKPKIELTKENNIDYIWTTIVKKMKSMQSSIVSMNNKKNEKIYVKLCTRPTIDQQLFFDSLDFKHRPFVRKIKVVPQL